MEYPVLYLDLNTNRYLEKRKLFDMLDRLFREWEERYGVEVKDTEYSQRFASIIASAHEKTGRQVVVLVDEYDKPLVGNLNKQEIFEDYRAQLASIYSNFKSSAEHLRLVFMTGVSRFSRLNIFSDLNNIEDITFDKSYADICGITENEIKVYFQDGLLELADKNHMSYDGALRELKRNYEGYRFSADGSDIYNPWSLLNALKKSSIENYWNDTGLPTIVAESLKRMDADLEETFNYYCKSEDLKGLDLLNPDPTALLYQTGYLTIKGYQRKLHKFRLGIPNNEVKTGLYKILLPYYVSCSRKPANRIVEEIIDNFICGYPDKAMRSMHAFFAGIDYKMKMDNENNFYNAFYLLTHIIGLDTETEVHTSDGSIDLKIETEDYIYIIGLKYDHSPEKALQQIEDKHFTLV